jgi:ABC-type polysaccharide/polyol phosphate transport system ATPase subunit
MNKIVVETRNLGKTYNLYSQHSDRVKEVFHPFRKKFHRPYHALHNVSIQIRQGEFYGIIGRNGSGKSTLLQLITGILQPSEGSVSVDGRISALLELGAGFNPDFTGRENVFLNASILGFSKEETERRFEEITAFADIGDFINQPVKTYSSGMYVRLAFAVAISAKPDILIVDEALAVGDMFFQQKCIRYMEEAMRGCTKILVTHDMHAVTNLCERVAVLEKGNLVFEGLPVESAEYYTKMMHNDLFGKADHAVVLPTGVRGDSVAKDRDDATDWIAVDAESTAGASDAVIRFVRLRSKDASRVTTAKPGDFLNIQMIIEVRSPISDPIFGYTIKDRVGNGICGDNSLSLSRVEDLPERGEYIVSLGIQWPDIYPADYTITLGVGQGNHPLFHVIQCWAHNVLLVKAINPGKNVHGIFTNAIEEFEVVKIA